MITGSPRSSTGRDHRVHERRTNPRALTLRHNRERGQVRDGAPLSTVVEPRGRDHHVPDDTTLDFGNERQVGDEAVRRAEGFDQPRLARLAEGCFDDLRDLTEVTGLFGSNRHVHTRIVTTGTGATPTN